MNLALAGGGCPTRARAAVKLVRFDSPRFVAELRAELRRRGWGAKARMEREAGVANGTIKTMFESGHARDIDVILSICAWMNWSVDEFSARRPLEPVETTGRDTRLDQVDWPLVKACASLLCGNDPVQLAEKSGLSYRVCSRILNGLPCNWTTFLKLCKALKLWPRQLFFSTKRRVKKPRYPTYKTVW